MVAVGLWQWVCGSRFGPHGSAVLLCAVLAASQLGPAEVFLLFSGLLALWL
jgi:hypothetical protein